MDAVYMTATQAMTGQGGWPMTVFMTPDREPFFCGTYFPRDQFQRLVLGRGQGLAGGPGQRHQPGQEIAAALAERAAPLPGWRGTGGGPGGDRGRLAERLRPGRRPAWPRSYDAARGGFGGAPKFPPSMVLEFLLRHSERGAADRQPPRRRCGWSRAPPTAMARGGMYDQLGGGFARYSRGRRLGRAALREDALRQRAAGPGVRAPVAAHRVGAGPPGGPGDLRLDDRASCGTAEGGLAVGAGRGQRRRGGPLLHLDARPS